MKSMQRAFGVLLIAVVSVVVGAVEARAQVTTTAGLTVVNAGPSGEIASLAEANEVRVIFSEPMVTLGRIPTVVRAPFFRISPALNGTFRWSGTTILIFTRDPKQPLPFATRYQVTIETTAIAVSGRRLAKPFTFDFTTPTVKLLNTQWYRRGGRADSPAVIALRFNQPIRQADVISHMAAKFQPHEWDPPSPPVGPDVLGSLDPLAVSRFNAKVAATRTVASAKSPVTLRITNDWDRKRIPAGPDLVVFETTSPVPSESWVELVLDDGLPSPAGQATPPSTQTYTVKVEPAFFINGFDCTTQCDPDRWNPINMRTAVKATDFAKAVRAVDVTTPSSPRAVARAAAPRSESMRSNTKETKDPG